MVAYVHPQIPKCPYKLNIVETSFYLVWKVLLWVSELLFTNWTSSNYKHIQKLWKWTCIPSELTIKLLTIEAAELCIWSSVVMHHRFIFCLLWSPATYWSIRARTGPAGLPGNPKENVSYRTKILKGKKPNNVTRSQLAPLQLPDNCLMLY